MPQQRGGGGLKRPWKKPKRSKGYWMQRKTITMTEVPKSESEEEDEHDVGNVDEEEGYARLCSVFDSNSGRSTAIDSEDDLDVDDDAGEARDTSTSAGDTDESEEVADEDEVDNERQSEDGDENEETDTGHDEESVERESDFEDSSSGDDDEKSAGDPSDPFVARYESGGVPTELREAAESKRHFSPEDLSWKHLGRLTLQRVEWGPGKKRKEGDRVKRRKVALDDGEDGEADNRESRAAQHRNNLVSGPVMPFSAKQAMERGYVKEQLSRNVASVNIANLATSSVNVVSAFQAQLFSLVSSYRDLLFTDRSYSNGEQIRIVYTLHALNHVLKTRTRIVKNNTRLAKGEDVGECRDQGLTRPKVLIVVPFRDSVKRVVGMMAELLFGKEKLKSGGGVGNTARFYSEYDAADQERRNKPDDFYDTFSGNVDDAFNLGIAVTKKSLKLYADFYSSDVIISSPLGLRMAMGSSDDETGGKQNSDFLSSIEVLILDQVDVFAMQNWEHVTGLFEGLNMQPKNSHGVDFTRVRMWALNKQSIFYRQTILFSALPMPEATALFNRRCFNYMGKLRSCNPVPNGGGNITKVMVNVPIVFHRFETESVMDSPNDRFDYFTSRIMPEYKKDVMYHTCVFVPSYFDYVRVRNWFSKADLDFLEVCEYTKDAKIAKARDHFFHGETHFLLYTERCHFFRRFAIKGIRHLIFFQPPQYPHFFSEMCNYLQPAFQNRKGGGSDGNMTITVLYSKYDAQRLAGILGTERAGQIVAEEKSVRMFVAGS